MVGDKAKKMRQKGHGVEEDGWGEH
jgi:hypothetical protein